VSSKIAASVVCPLCGDTIHGEVDSITRSDILMGHLVERHASKIRPSHPKEGPPLPRGLGIKWPHLGTNTVLKVVCMYCGRRMPDRPGYGVTGTSAGFCEVCWAERYPGVPYPTEEEARAPD